MSLLNLHHQLVFYRAYHFNKKNVRIHMVFVPTILFTSLLMAAYYRFDSFFPQVATPYSYVFNAASIWSYSSLAYYLILDRAALLTAPFLLLAPVGFAYLYEIFPAAQIIKPAASLFVFSWIAQFYGHAVYEGRSPALFDNLIQALVLAPYFVLFEVLFFFGFRKDLERAVDNEAGVRARDFILAKKRNEKAA
ncbi:unnamed protein product [Kuraishia capsulata CBS 1993]|uniref:DUF962 domain protein n=1 Tax=Kuraishia capsulata CBS 1993 TaxID=1382522 RepID=W6MM06_9ASCO|nr:uncharacterized protein KUCA_T00003191001 [Kuraishia capsulata CBS 1993]CDK27213.1 unnamed protein product [Kuraishia capsulata CBS 1993]